MTDWRVVKEDIPLEVRKQLTEVTFRQYRKILPRMLGPRILPWKNIQKRLKARFPRKHRDQIRNAEIKRAEGIGQTNLCENYCESHFLYFRVDKWLELMPEQYRLLSIGHYIQQMRPGEVRSALGNKGYRISKRSYWRMLYGPQKHPAVIDYWALFSLCSEGHRVEAVKNILENWHNSAQKSDIYMREEILIPVTTRPAPSSRTREGALA